MPYFSENGAKDMSKLQNEVSVRRVKKDLRFTRKRSFRQELVHSTPLTQWVPALDVRIQQIEPLSGEGGTK